MKKSVFYVLFFFAMLSVMVSCQPTSPEPNPQPEPQKEVNRLSILNEIKQYFPYSTESDYMFVNDQTGVQWRLTPYTLQPFPTIQSYTFYEETEEWENYVAAEFVVDGVGNAHRTSHYIDIATSGEGFEVHLGCEIQINSEERYFGSINNMRSDTAWLWSFLSDTITVPIKSISDGQGPERGYEQENAYIHLIRSKGLYDFCLDGQSVWRRVEK